MSKTTIIVAASQIFIELDSKGTYSRKLLKRNTKANAHKINVLKKNWVCLTLAPQGILEDCSTNQAASYIYFIETCYNSSALANIPSYANSTVLYYRLLNRYIAIIQLLTKTHLLTSTILSRYFVTKIKYLVMEIHLGIHIYVRIVY